jgi:hypothetical protein
MFLRLPVFPSFPVKFQFESTRETRAQSHLTNLLVGAAGATEVMIEAIVAMDSVGTPLMGTGGRLVVGTGTLLTGATVGTPEMEAEAVLAEAEEVREVEVVLVPMVTL